jgi:hypothetical protein
VQHHPGHAHEQQLGERQEEPEVAQLGPQHGDGEPYRTAEQRDREHELVHVSPGQSPRGHRSCEHGRGVRGSRDDRGEQRIPAQLPILGDPRGL